MPIAPLSLSATCFHVERTDQVRNESVELFRSISAVRMKSRNPPTFNHETRPGEPSPGDALHDHIEYLETELKRLHRLSVLGTLAALIAHEVNNTLTPVMSYAQLAKEHPEDYELVSKALDRAAKGSMRASAIASAILGLSRGSKVSRGAATVSNLSECVEAVLLCLGNTLASANVCATVENDLNTTVEPIMSQHLVLNLVLNAQRAMRGRQGAIGVNGFRVEAGNGIPPSREGWGRRTTDLSLLDASARHVSLVVSDSGAGIPAAVMDGLFAEHPTHREGRVGLGLVMCQQAVAAARGAIVIDSRVEEGTVVAVLLPEAE